SRCGETRQPGGFVELRLRGRSRGAGLHARAAAGADRAVDRRARLRLPLRTGSPSRDAACGAGPARARAAGGVQRPRPAPRLGPLTTPAGARAQVVGVFAPDLVRTLADVLAQLGAERAFVVHGADGIDELSPAGPNLVAEVVDGQVFERVIDPLDIGVERCTA